MDWRKVRVDVGKPVRQLLLTFIWNVAWPKMDAGKMKKKMCGIKKYLKGKINRLGGGGIWGKRKRKNWRCF